jgi:hypothetical protein
MDRPHVPPVFLAQAWPSVFVARLSMKEMEF